MPITGNNKDGIYVTYPYRTHDASSMECGDSPPVTMVQNPHAISIDWNSGSGIARVNSVDIALLAGSFVCGHEPLHGLPLHDTEG